MARLANRVNALHATPVNRAGSRGVANALNDLARWYPPMWFWLAAGLIAACVARRRSLLVAAALVAAGILVLFVTLLGYGPTLDYGLPFDAVFVLFAAASVTVALSRRRAWRRSSRARARPCAS